MSFDNTFQIRNAKAYGTNFTPITSGNLLIVGTGTDGTTEWTKGLSIDSISFQDGSLSGSSELGLDMSSLIWTQKDSNRNWQSICMSSSGQYQSAVVYGGYIYISSDYGNTWTATNTGGTNSYSSICMSASGKYQLACSVADTLFLSSNYGSTWTSSSQTGSLQSVCMSSTGKYMSVCAYNGYIYISSDYGTTWTQKSTIDNYKSICMSSTGQYQSVAAKGNQIRRSVDYGNTWTAIGTARSWMSISMSSTGQYQTSTVEVGNIYVSSDSGVTWTSKNPGSTYWVSNSVSATGKYQVALINGGLVYVSSNYGNTWTSTSTSNSAYGIAISSSGQYISYGIYGGNINVCMVPYTMINATGNINTSGTFTVNGSAIAVSAGSVWSVSGSMISYSGGNVGIGSGTPAYKLDVVGGAQFTNTVILNPAGGLAVDISYFIPTFDYLLITKNWSGSSIPNTGRATCSITLNTPYPATASNISFGIGGLNTGPSEVAKINSTGLVLSNDKIITLNGNSSSSTLEMSDSTGVLKLQNNRNSNSYETVLGGIHSFKVNGSEIVKINSVGLSIGSNTGYGKYSVCIPVLFTMTTAASMYTGLSLPEAGSYMVYAYSNKDFGVSPVNTVWGCHAYVSWQNTSQAGFVSYVGYTNNATITISATTGNINFTLGTISSYSPIPMYISYTKIL